MTNFLFKTKKRKLIFSLILVLLIIAPISFYLWNKQAGASWWNSDWNYRRSITINSAQIPGDLNNFPMLVSFTDSNLINKTQSNGNDIIFIEENGTRLNHEIEKFDNTTGELVAWVKIPELDGDNDSIIYMYYGNQTVDNQQRPEDVWDDNFKTVQHLEEGGTGTRFDSTRSNTDGTTQNFNGDESISAAKINGGADLEDDDNTYFDLGNPEALNISQQITLSAWVKVESDLNNGRILSRHVIGSYGYIFARGLTNDNFELSISTNGSNWYQSFSAPNTFLVNNWYYVVATYNGSTERLYINGNEHIGGNFPYSLAGSINISSASTQIGRDVFGGDASVFDGIIDEVRISNSARSANWITTEYNNQNSPATFISLGSEERGPAPVLYLPFDEGFGTTAYDETSNRNDGTIVGATWKDESMCKSGKCLEFDGTGDYVEIADNQSLDLSEEVTLEAWVKPTSTTPQNQTIISKEEKSADPTKIYRSVGPSATTAIAVGTSNAMNITGDRATFATSLPNNVGVGDAIQYDANDDGTVDALAFITGRISNTQYTISNASGGAPNPVNADNNWSLFRAYTSLANAEKGVENTGIDSDLRNFDDWTAGGDATTDDVGKDLVAANQQWNIACYANGTTADNAIVNVGNWITGVNNFLNIYTPININEVGVSQRHGGKWDENKYKMSASSSFGHVLGLGVDYVRVSGLQLGNFSDSSRGINLLSSGNFFIDSCIIKDTWENGIRVDLNGKNLRFYIWNNIIYDNIVGIYFRNSASSLNGYLYNNTIFGNGTGVESDSFTNSGLYFKNNISVGNTTNYNFLTSFPFLENNLTDQAPNSSIARGATYTTGTTDGTTASKLMHSTATFITNGVQIGSIIKNTTDNTYTYVTALDSETQLSIANDIFVSGENYSIYKNKYGNVSFVSTTAGSEDFHLSPTDTVAKNSGADLSGDSVFPFNSDIDGQSRDSSSKVGMTDKWDIGADEARATQIYRSVAPGKTDALETGDGNAMTINGSIATFQRALADNVGVGDAIQYDANNDGTVDAIAFISERYQNSKFKIQNSVGGTPTAVVGDNDWSLFRAYTSLANAENGDENTGIDSDLRNFDTWTGGKDLVTSKEQWNIACYANGTTADSTAVTVDGWTTGAQNFVKIYTPVSESEVGISQRHNGTPITGYYMRPPDEYHESIVIVGNQDYTVIEGIGFTGRSLIDDRNGGIYSAGGSNNITIDSCLFYDMTFASVRAAIFFDYAGLNIIIKNNFFTNIDGKAIRIDRNGYLYNNTAYDTSGIGDGSRSALIGKNNISMSPKSGYTSFNGNWDASSSNNISSDSSASGTGSLANQALSDIDFVSTTSGSEDLHILGTSVARNAGVNLSNDPNFPFETDIDGDKRLDLQEGGTTSWDIGADEAVATKIYRSVGPGNTSALATDEGHKNSAVVSSGVVNFSSSLPDRVGVGDAVLIDTNNDNSITSADTLLFISGRISSTSYSLQTHTGAVPSNISSNDAYQIFRAYTSLANAESGTKNASIPITFNGGDRDLVTNNEEWNIACYGDSVDTETVYIDGWATGAENYLKIYTPANSIEVGSSQRHNGTWGSGYRRLAHIQVQENYVKVDGMSIQQSGNCATWSDRVYMVANVSGQGGIEFSNNFGHITNTSTPCDVFDVTEVDNIPISFINNIGITDSTGGSNAFYVNDSDAVAHLYNNTGISNASPAFAVQYSASTISAINNIGYSAGTSDFTNNFDVFTNNASADSTGNLQNRTFSFRDAANDDYRLAMTDTAAKGAGLNLSNDANLPITHDIEGEKRPSLVNSHQSSAITDYGLPITSSWDIGADQISTTTHNNYSLNLKTNYPQTKFSTTDNDQENFSSGDINLEPNEWSHIVYKRSNDIEEMYINGSKKDSGTISNFLKTNNGKLYLGAKDTNSTNSFKGFLDEVRIYPYARTEDEVKKDTTQGSSGRAASRASEGVGVAIGETGNSLSDGLVGYWKMDESSWNGTTNEVVDASGNNNHGTANGGASTTAGKFGNGGGFDGTDDWVTVNDNDSISTINAYTYAAWVRFDSDTSLLDSLISKKSQIGITRTFLIARTSAGGGVVGGKVRLAVTHNGTENYTSWDYPYQEWFHLAVRWDGLNIYIYKNGILLNQFAASGLLETTDYPLIIGDGDNNFSWDGIFDGAQDDIRLYNRALSEDEIKQLYNYAPGPVLHLKMDEKSGTTAYDSSGYNNHGTLTNGPIWENGKINSGINFDGGDDYVDITDDDSFNLAGNNFTLSAWYKQDTLTGGIQRIIAFPADEISGAENFSIYVDGSNACFLKRGPSNDDIICVTPTDIGAWHYLSGVYDGQEMRIYIDGILKDKKSSSVAIIDSNDNLQIGRYGPSWGQYFDGSIDDVKIYNYARTQEQILEDMGSQSSSVIGSEGNTLKKPILDLNFNEGQGSTAYDSSGNGNNGVLNAGGSGTNATTTAMWDKGGKFGGAVEFDGTNDSVEATNATSFDSTDNTYSVWIKPSVLGDAKTIMDLDFDEQWLGIHNSQYTIYGRCGQHGYGVPNTTSWQHIVWTVKGGGDYNLYANGERIGTGSGCNASVNADKLTIGSTNNSERFSGLIDEVKFYNYVLSEDEVIALYNDSSAMVMGNDESRDNNGTEVTGANKDYCVPGDTAKCDKPVLELKMDEMTGTTAYDTSGNGNNGTFVNGPVWDIGKIGSGINFNGSDSYLNLGSSSTLNMYNSNYTLQSWVYLRSHDPSYTDDVFARGAYGCGHDFGISAALQPSPNRVYLHHFGAGAPESDFGNTDVSLNAWHHIAVTYDNVSHIATYYLDGKMDGQKTINAMVNCTTRTSYVGVDGRDVIDFVPDGSMDDIRIYNYARTPAQIAWDYNQGKPINHWTFDEGTGSTVHDEGPNLNNGTITGATWKNESECKSGKCLYFDGLDTTRVDADTQDNMSQFTACAWVNAKSWTNAGADGEIFIISKGWSLRLINDGKINLYVPTSSTWVDYRTTSSLVLDEWHRVCAVFAGVGQNSKIFIDGIDQELSTSWWGTGTLSDNSSRILRVGASDNNSYYGNFNGYIDDPKIYNYALTDEQIKMDYNDGAVNFR